VSQGPDIGVLLERALRQMAAAAGIDLTIVEAGWTRWASATFSGARHDLSLSASASPTLDLWLARLPEADFTLRRHLVADLAIESRTRIGDRIVVRIGALTVEEG